MNGYETMSENYKILMHQHEKQAGQPLARRVRA